MHRYTLGIKHNFRHVEEVSRRTFQRFRKRFLRFLGTLAIILSPAMALGLWYYNSSTSVDSVFYQDNTSRIAPDEALSGVTVSPDIIKDASFSQKEESKTEENKAPVKAEVKVNGRTVPVSKSGSVHKEITDEKGTTSVDIQIKSTSSESSNTQSSVNIELNSNTESSDDRQ